MSCVRAVSLPKYLSSNTTSASYNVVRLQRHRWWSSSHIAYDFVADRDWVFQQLPIIGRNGPALQCAWNRSALFLSVIFIVLHQQYSNYYTDCVCWIASGPHCFIQKEFLVLSVLLTVYAGIPHLMCRVLTVYACSPHFFIAADFIAIFRHFSSEEESAFCKMRHFLRPFMKNWGNKSREKGCGNKENALFRGKNDGIFLWVYKIRRTFASLLRTKGA